MLASLLTAIPRTLEIGLLAGLIGLGAGTLLGLAAGWFRGATDLVIRTACDVMMTIPAISSALPLLDCFDELFMFHRNDFFIAFDFNACATIANNPDVLLVYILTG